MKITELEDQAKSQARLIKSLKTEQTELKNGMNDMSKELEVKVREVLQVRSEANQTLKCVHCSLFGVIFFSVAYLSVYYIHTYIHICNV